MCKEICSLKRSGPNVLRTEVRTKQHEIQIVTRELKQSNRLQNAFPYTYTIISDNNHKCDKIFHILF